MLKSMTAFGRGCAVSDLGRVTVEINSVNRRFLDVNVFLPAELSSFDFDIKKWVGAAVERGQVTVKVFASYTEAAPIEVRPNLALARQIHHCCSQIAELTGVDTQILTAEFMSRSKELLETEQSENLDAYRCLLEEAVQDALTSFVASKVSEGQGMERDIRARIQSARSYLALIQESIPRLVPQLQARLTEKLSQYSELLPDNSDRILREVSLYADKVDISEEITRAGLHLDELELLVTQDGQASGKKLDFILQELHRESNTIQSKSGDIEISRAAIEIKTELERVREQVQNVE